MLARAPEALPIAEASLSLCAQLPPSQDRDAMQAALHVSIGTLHSRVNQFQKAAALLRSALATYKHLGDEDATRKVRSQLNAMLQISSAAPEPDDGDLTADISDIDRDYARILQGTELLHKGKLVEAELLARQVLESVHVNESARRTMFLRVFALSLLVDVLFRGAMTHELLKEAVPHLREQLALLRSPQLLHVLYVMSFRASINLIRSYGGLGQVDAARVCLQEALDEAEARPAVWPARELATHVIVACRGCALAEARIVDGAIVVDADSPHREDAFALAFLRRALPATSPQILQQAKQDADRIVNLP